MSDDRQPSDAPADPAPVPDPAPVIQEIRVKLTVSQIKEQRVEACRDMLDRQYSPHQVMTWASSKTSDKDWQITPRSARRYIDEALERVDADVAQPKSRKQARVRGMLTLFARRALELCQDPKHVGKAAGLITSGVAALDKIARIDGAYEYDGSLLLPSGIQPATADEAVRIIQHAAATIELAQRRKSLALHGPVPPPVIDVTADDVDGEDTPDEIPSEPSGDAN